MSGDYQEEHNIPAAKSQISLALDLLNTQVPRLTEKDVVMVRRAGKVEVWTMKPFPKHGLMLVPYSTEIKDT